MSSRVVCDTMVFYQWATIRRERLHGVHSAVLEGRVRLCVSPELLSEVRDLLARPSIRAKSPHLTDDRVNAFLNALLAKAELTPTPPRAFTLPDHPKDNHLFNLAIAAKAERLVTWEERILKLQNWESADGRRLRALAPQLHIVTPSELSVESRSEERPAHS